MIFLPQIRSPRKKFNLEMRYVKNISQSFVTLAFETSQSFATLVLNVHERTHATH